MSLRSKSTWGSMYCLHVSPMVLYVVAVGPGLLQVDSNWPANRYCLASLVPSSRNAPSPLTDGSGLCGPCLLVGMCCFAVCSHFCLDGGFLYLRSDLFWLTALLRVFLLGVENWICLHVLPWRRRSSLLDGALVSSPFPLLGRWLLLPGPTHC
jgi:hypothetical protein